MKKALVVVLSLMFAATLFAQSPVEVEKGNGKAQPANGFAGSGGGAGNLVYHTNGVVSVNAKVVLIFWGDANAFGTATTPSAYAAAIQGFRNQFGATGEYNTIGQYYGVDNATGTYTNISSGPGYSVVGSQADSFVGSNPPSTNVTDAMVQGAVQSYVASHGADYSTIYEVFIPNGYFSSDGSQGSCGASGGVTLAYCAYHSHYVDGAKKNVLYSIEPYPSCSGCQVSGWTAAQNQEHFVCHETREAVTDSLGNAWFDRRGYEADDKCAWSPSPFIGTNGYGYQYEWSNASSACVKTR